MDAGEQRVTVITENLPIRPEEQRVPSTPGNLLTGPPPGLVAEVPPEMQQETPPQQPAVALAQALRRSARTPVIPERFCRPQRPTRPPVRERFCASMSNVDTTDTMSMAEFKATLNEQPEQPVDDPFARFEAACASDLAAAGDAINKVIIDLEAICAPIRYRDTKPGPDKDLWRAAESEAWW